MEGARGRGPDAPRGRLRRLERQRRDPSHVSGRRQRAAHVPQREIHLLAGHARRELQSGSSSPGHHGEDNGEDVRGDEQDDQQCPDVPREGRGPRAGR